MNAKLRTLALVALVAVGVAAGLTIAASNGTLTASPATPGETSTHTAALTAEENSSGALTGFEVNYSGTGVDVSNVSNESVVSVGIDEGADAEGDTVDQDVSDDLDSVTTSNDGATVTFEFGGSYDLAAGDEIVVAYESVQNGDAGEHEVALDINPQSSGGEGMAMVTFGEDTTESTVTATEPTETDLTTQERSKNVTDNGTDEGTQTMTPETDTDQTTLEEAEESEETTNGETTEDESGMDETETEIGVGDETDTEVSSPGFGLALAVLALIGAAFVATRRNN